MALPLAARFEYDAEKNILFLNFGKLEVETLADLKRMQENVERLCAPLETRLFAIVSCDAFSLQRDVEDAYLEMVRDVVKRFYLSVTRYTTSSFVRANLGPALGGRNVVPHVHEAELETLKNLVASV